MKFVVFALLTLGFLSVGQAKEIQSTNKSVKVARVVELYNLVKKPHVQVNVVVEDLGGSTDVSPSQTVHFNIYSKGEMFSTDASFKLADVLKVISATRISAGIYQVVVEKFNDDYSIIGDVVLEINAVDALVAMKAVDCDDFDCDASSNFSASIEVIESPVQAKP